MLKSTFVRLAVGTTAALATTLVVAPTPAHASCSVNHYRVERTTGLFAYPGTPTWLRDKHAGDAVAGPNSNVMPNMNGSFRIVYLGGGGLGQIYAPDLTYINCD
jgi:hypothetical protein